ncbi:MAG: T9SS type A sorting domain-containing protein, partial [Chitinophagales bacterium]
AVFHRATSADEWAEVNNVTQNTQGSSTDRRGSFIINNLQFGEYTLAFVDMDRTDPISTSNPECILTDIEGESLKQNTYFQLFPNPASKQNDLLTLRFLKSNNAPKTIRVYQTNGQLLQEEMVNKGKEAHSISLQNWNSGVYLLQVFEGEKLMGIERFFVVD